MGRLTSHYDTNPKNAKFCEESFALIRCLFFCVFGLSLLLLFFWGGTLIQNSVDLKDIYIYIYL